MILQLNPESFQPFGTILPDSKADGYRPNLHSISLTQQKTVFYQTAGEVTLNSEKGRAILSVCQGHTTYDFYLNRPVTLKPGIRFGLTAFRNAATVACSGWSLPTLLETKAAALQIATRPSLRVTEILTFLYQEKEQGFLFPGEAHTMAELTYVDRGTLHSVADGCDLQLQQGQLMLYAPNQWHMQYAAMDVAPRFVTITFHIDGADISPVCNKVLQPSQKTVQLLTDLLRERERSDGHSADMLIHTLSLLLVTLLRESDNTDRKLQPTHSVNSENEIIRKAQQYVSLHVREKLSVPVVAQAVQVSASYLTALFHKHLQLSPGEYIRRIKLQESKQLIREGNMNFTEIAEALQYSTVHHFSRQFKEKFGITPTEYAHSVR